MFKSTFGHVDAISQYGHRPFFAYKAVDFDRHVEIFKIGSESNADEYTYGEIYCLNLNGNNIPFGIKSIPDSYIKVDDLLRSKWGIKSEARFPVVKIKVKFFGVNLSSINVGFRGSMDYADMWGEADCHSHVFESEEEKCSAFKLLQEGFPVFAFGEYERLCGSYPKVCKSVLPNNIGDFPFIDCSENIEKLSFTLECPLDKPESPKFIIDRLIEASNKTALSMEELFCELLSVEYECFIFGNMFISTVLSSELITPVFRKTYDTYYTDRYLSFESFRHYISDILRARRDRREVYTRFAYA